jgi:hypothetical protein
MTVKELLEKLENLDPEAQVLADDGEFGPYEITETSPGFRRRDGYFSDARIKRKRPKSYRSAVLLH